jgi:hypothetical protein
MLPDSATAEGGDRSIDYLQLDAGPTCWKRPFMNAHNIDRRRVKAREPDLRRRGVGRTACAYGGLALPEYAAVVRCWRM